MLSRTQRTSLPFDQAPGYPYLVAGIYATFGPRVTAVAVVQAVLDAITCVAIARVGRRCFGAPAGLVAGLLAVAYGSFIYCTGELESATPFVCAVTVAVALALAPAWPRWLLSGACWALALLLRGEVLFAFPVMLADVWRRVRRRAHPAGSRGVHQCERGRDGRGGALRHEWRLQPVARQQSGRGRRQPVHLGTARGSGACARRPSDRCRRGGPTLPAASGVVLAGRAPRGHPAPLEEAPLDLDRPGATEHRGHRVGDVSERALPLAGVAAAARDRPAARGSGRASPRT
ncbi:MAG: glycosyltransferase family 39 protein [Deltaproteobacteria bacterium]|nr:MAG: glycosyltransferase family 39 protein [Deltaproteobacteria bacterium]